MNDPLGIKVFLDRYNQFIHDNGLQIACILIAVVIAALIIRSAKNLMGKLRIQKKPETGEFYSTWCTEEEISKIKKCSDFEFSDLLEGG